MTNFFFNFRRQLIAIAIIALGLTNTIEAQVLIDGVYYTFSSTTATVVANPDGTKYSGDIVIPDAVTYDGTSYNVKSVGAVFKDSPDLTSLTLGSNCGNCTGVQGCTSLKSFAWNNSSSSVRGMTLASRYNSAHFFYNCPELETIVLPGNVKIIPEQSFDSYDKLKSITLPSTCTIIETRAFSYCDSLQNINLEHVTTIGQEAFYWCNLKSINLTNATSIGESAFYYNRKLSSVIMPETMTDGNLGIGAFSTCSSISSIKLPNGITTIPKDLFYNCTNLARVDIPATVTHIEDGAFHLCENLPVEQILFEGLEYLGHNNLYRDGAASIHIPSTLRYIGCYNLRSYGPVEVTVAPGNQYFKVVGNILYSSDGKTLYCILGNPTEDFTIDNNTVETVWSHAFINSPLTNYNFPNLKEVKCYAFGRTNLSDVTIKKGVKYGENCYYFCDSTLTSVTIEEGVTELPTWCFYNCSNLKTPPTIPSSLTKLGPACFANCGFNYIKLGKSFNSFGASALSRYQRDGSNPDFTLELMSPVPPMCDSVYTRYDNEKVHYVTSWKNTLMNVTLIVPSGSVEAYKAHAKWGLCKEIIGNSEWAGIDQKQKLPDGFYFAMKGGNICYLQGGTIHDTGIPSGAHPFNMQIYNDAIYIADAGEQYYYQSSGDNDGGLYKIELFDDTYGITPIANKSIYRGMAYYDPQTCWVDQEAGEIYVGTRSVGIGRLPLNTDSYYSTQIDLHDLPRTFLRNWNLLPYYNRVYTFVYGAICKGIQKDKDGVYWCAFDFNGQGIYRFKESDIYSSSSEASSAAIPYDILAWHDRITSIYLDEKNGYLYGYFYNVSNSTTGTGLYRIALANLELYGTSVAYWELIDDSPASPQNETTDERVYTRQITGDGTNIYWSYIAADDADPINNPLHRSGIKMIPASGTPTVSYVLPDVEVYGIAPCNYDFVGIENVLATENTQNITITDELVIALTDCNVSIYNMNGVMQQNVELQMGEQQSLDLTPGIYIIKATDIDNGSTQIAKVVVK